MSTPARFGRYELLSRLGGGGMGEVWLARARGPERVQKTVVVKRLRPDRVDDEAARARFVDEARVAVTLSHPHLVPVFDFGSEAGEYFLVMEYLRGGDLSRIAGIDRAPLGWAAVTLIGSEVCEALAYVHAKSDRRGAHLVHGDVTPHNVLLSPEGHALLADFGLARFAPRDKAGTRRYQAPEQARGEAFDGRADLYALALVLCEAATGQPAYDRDPARAAEQAKVGISPPLDGVDAQLAAVLRRALAPSADGRPSSATALRELLEAQLDREPRARAVGRAQLAERLAALSPSPGAVSASRMTEATRAASPSRNWMWVGVVVGGLAAGAWWLRPSVKPPPPVEKAVVVVPSPPVIVVAPPPAPVISAAPTAHVNRAPRPRPAPPPPPEAPAPVEKSHLDLNVAPWAHVRIDGRDRGDTPLLDVELPAGTHRVELINEPLGVRRELVIELQPGEHARRVETLLPK